MQHSPHRYAHRCCASRPTTCEQTSRAGIADPRARDRTAKRPRRERDRQLSVLCSAAAHTHAAPRAQHVEPARRVARRAWQRSSTEHTHHSAEHRWHTDCFAEEAAQSRKPKAEGPKADGPRGHSVADRPGSSRCCSGAGQGLTVRSHVSDTKTVFTTYFIHFTPLDEPSRRTLVRTLVALVRIR